jgi:hypothetical protein
MEFAAATLLYPALLVALAVGAGLLVDRVAGARLPGVLVPAVGFAALVVVATLCTYWHVTAPLTPVALVAVGAAGLFLGWRRLRPSRLDWWPVAAWAAVYAVVCAPVLLSGGVTLAGYLLDTTVAFHVAGGEYLIDHARDFARLPESSFRQTMENYFGGQYPAGGQVLLAGAGRLTGVDSLWLYQPFLSAVVAFSVPPLYFVCRSTRMPRPAAAVASALAAVPALVYSYAQMGSIKELTALPLVLLLGALLALRPRLLELGVRGAVLPALVGAAGIAAIGIAFTAWLLAALAAGAALTAVERRPRRSDARPLAAWAATFAVLLAVLALPTLGPLSESLSLASSLSTSNAAAVADPGNLLRPLLRAQAAGVWLGGSHRVEPQHVGLTYALIGLVAAAALLGAAFLVRRRLWGLVAFAGVVAVVWAALTVRGTAWTDAKVLMLASPVVVLLAAFGVECMRRARWRLEALVLGAIIAAGVLASDAFVYHDTNLLPTDRYRELATIGDRFSDDGPALLPEFDELGLAVLRDMTPDAPGFAAKPPWLATLRDGSPTGYGHSYDLDELSLGAVRRYPTIVTRRRPDASRPPADFELAARGRHYDVWTRTAAERTVAHMPAGAGLQAGGQVSCGVARRLARRARSVRGSLRYVPRPLVKSFDPRLARRRPAGWTALAEGVALATPGSLHRLFTVPGAGRYRVWLKGDFARPLHVSIDDRRIGEVSGQTGNEGNYAPPLEAALERGEHRLSLERPGGGLRPGDGAASRLLAVVFEPARDHVRYVLDARPGEWRDLCRLQVDWIEVAQRS